MGIDWEIICTVTTATAAILALFISIAQIKISNRQQLVGRRIRLWGKAYGLTKLCKDNRSLLEERQDIPEFANDIVFNYMTNNSLLHDIGSTIKHVLEPEWQNRLLIKVEELKEMAFEAELLFWGRPAKVLGAFITDYASLLMSMYKYQIVLEHINETCKELQYDLEQATSAVEEEQHRTKLYEARDNLLNSFDALSPTLIKKVISQCKLTWLS